VRPTEVRVSLPPPTLSARTKIRRVIIAGLLGMVVVLIVLGQTAAVGRLGPLATLVYWLTCLVVTFGAILLALVDLLKTLGETRREEQELLRATLDQIKAESDGKPGADVAGDSR
jgi:hypothetical protein